MFSNRDKHLIVNEAEAVDWLAATGCYEHVETRRIVQTLYLTVRRINGNKML